MPLLDAASESVLCPVVSPLNDGEIDQEALARTTEFILDGGVDGMYPCGSTGEFASLTPDQRQQVIQTVSQHAGDAPVIAAAAGTSTEETLSRVEDANRAGADAAAVVAPYFHSANQAEGTLQFFEIIADQTSLPLFLYNIPMHVGTGISAQTVKTLAEHDSIQGMKDTSGDFLYFLRVDKLTPDEFLLFQGFDSLLVPSLRTGSNGGIHALANVIPEVFSEIVECAHTERGMYLQQEAVAPLLELCLEYGIAPAMKTALVHQDVIPTDDVKTPLVPLSSEEKSEIHDAVDHAQGMLMD
ncbi:dihydrodipicolinate synthase family protein [Halalkalicoccus tibetensis]|uniref:Dihydrodipicolinate synthase family protein n=1 Tax=Halalkalicoccus tibetensis TaxID=175632 RepID=A0ABD5V682_9EURY